MSSVDNDKFVVRFSLWGSIRKTPYQSLIAIPLLVIGALLVLLHENSGWEFYFTVGMVAFIIIVSLYTLLFPSRRRLSYVLSDGLITYNSIVSPISEVLKVENLSSFKCLYLFQDNRYDQFVLSRFDCKDVNNGKKFIDIPYLEYEPNPVVLRAFGVDKTTEEQIAAFKNFAPHLLENKLMEPAPFSKKWRFWGHYQ